MLFRNDHKGTSNKEAAKCRKRQTKTNGSSRALGAVAPEQSSEIIPIRGVLFRKINLRTSKSSTLEGSMRSGRHVSR